ncbi:MAG: hypothetical protein Q8K51_04310 [Nitrospirota bacterium]|nr:hypothetical protein [Nitrospirota bacterium]
MKFLAYAWIIIVRIFIVFISFRLFSIASNTFETVVIAILILIYAELQFSRYSSEAYYLEQRQQYFHQMNVLKDPDYMPGGHLHDLFSKEGRNNFKMFMIGISSLIISLLAVWKILNSIFS